MKNAGARRSGRPVEWPTVILAVGLYASWVALTAWHAAMPFWIFAPLCAMLITLHGSFQHELIHGHPTRAHRINNALGWLPLGLWLPYATYRRSHLAHHAAGHITEPADDPESRYLAAPRSTAEHIVATMEGANRTLAARLTIGPAVMLFRFAVEEGKRIVLTPKQFARDWLPHIAGVVIVLTWLSHVGLGWRIYAVAVVYPGISLSLLRSFAEHRASPDHRMRVATVDSRGLLAFLFLNNNLHVSHHLAPSVPWYRLPAFDRHRRASDDAHALRYAGYGEIIWRFLFRSHDRLLHPAHEAERIA